MPSVTGRIWLGAPGRGRHAGCTVSPLVRVVVPLTSLVSLACLASLGLVACGDDPSSLDGSRRGAEPSGSGSSGAGASGGAGASSGGPGDTTAPSPSPPSCAPIPGSAFEELSVPRPSDRPAQAHADLNLAMRKVRVAAGAAKALVDVSGPTDGKAPKLFSLFSPDRTPAVAAVYEVEQWDWGCNCAKGYITDPEVTLAGLASTPGEILRMPRAGYDIGGGHGAVVLYARGGTITLKLTRDDDVVSGYALHLDGVCIEPSLLAAYEAADRAGRRAMPALKPGQAFGRAAGSEVKVAVRDTGSFMDPRSRKDWW